MNGGDLTDKELDSLFRKIRRCKPIITEAKVFEIDKVAASAPFGIGRRIGLMIASKNGAWFRTFETASIEEAQALACGNQEISNHIRHLENLIDLLKTAQVRFGIAFCVRPDSPELYAKAEEEVGKVPPLIYRQSNGKA